MSAARKGPVSARRVYVGTAGWSLERSMAPGSRPGQTGLERYAEYFDAVEINATFYRNPRPATLERWRDSTPPEFRFAVKLPKAITHEAGLVGVKRELGAFCRLVAHLGPKLGPLLVQLPPSADFEVRRARSFMRHLRELGAARVVFEPRHASWFSERAERLLSEHGIARVAADPAAWSPAAQPAGAPELVYFRWHGSPRMYFSAYEPERILELARQAQTLAAQRPRCEIYCFFDNTALGAAAVNALSLKSELAEPRVRQVRP